MRKFISYLMFAVAAVFFTGCIDVNVTPIEPQGPTTVNLQLRNADLVATRAITDDNQYNEDLINSVQCFFTVTDTDAVVYATDLVPVNAHQTKTLALEIPAEYLSTLFANNATKCDVYVVANYGSKITETTITAVKAKGITLSGEATQTSFVMDGTAEVTLNGTALSATVNLYRAAAKIIVKANIKTPIVEGATSWIPQIGGIKMTYNGSVNGSKISAAAADAVTSTAVTYTQTTGVFTKDEKETTTDYYVGYQTVPFYSFPVAASANKGGIDMIIPWKMGDTDNVVEYKYQIPVDIALERNHVYLLEVNVEVLGLVEGAELTPSYVIVDWTVNPITAGLSRPKYLVVDETEVILNNVETYSVGYKASDDVVITQVGTHTFQSIYSSNKETWNAVYPFSLADNISISEDESNIIFEHQLDNTTAAGTNDPASRYDYQKNTVTIRVSLKSDSKIYEDITFVQYPAMYVETGTSVSGSVYVNKNQSTTNQSSSNNWAYVGSGSQGMSSNMYKITVGAFDESTSKYIICDPREPSNSNTFSFNSVTTATDVSGDNTLTGYRATIVGPESANLVAPEFIVASGYGFYQVSWSNMNAKTTAKYRCAGYQEAGYPAGRWRVPTPAELEVIGKLCSEGKIPSIFYGTYSYMSSNGPYYYNSNGTFRQDGDVDTNGDSIRCVYDTWYWKDKSKNTNQFIWGAEGDIAGGAKSTYLESLE